MHTIYKERIEAFCRRQGLHSDRALAAYAAKLGPAAVARRANVPEDLLRSFLSPHAEVLQSVCNVSAQVHCTGLKRFDTPPTHTSVHALRPRVDAFPESFEIDAPRITDEDNQGEIGSCVGWGGKNGAEVLVAAALGMDGFVANPSWLYGRIKERNGDTDHGATLGDLATVLREDGIAEWDSMPVHRTAPEGNPGNLPLPTNAARDAVKRKVKGIYWLDEWDADITRALLYGTYNSGPARPLPIIFGAALYESLFNAQTVEDGIVPMPLDDEVDRHIGNHCMAVIGWISINGELYLKVKNSWGKAFGDGGYLYFSLRYAQQYFHGAFVCHTLVQESHAQRRVPSASAPLAIVGTIALLLTFILLAFTQSEAFDAWNSPGIKHSSVPTPTLVKNEPSTPEESQPSESELAQKPNEPRGHLDGRKPIQVYLDIVRMIGNPD